jgi:hypothetical protein
MLLSRLRVIPVTVIHEAHFCNGQELCGYMRYACLMDLSLRLIAKASYLSLFVASVHMHVICAAC